LPKKELNARCLIRSAFISPPAFFKTLPFSILKQGAVWMGVGRYWQKEDTKKSIAAAA
jgi:hypothetical protein